PGKVPAGKQSESLQSLVDLAPSFLSAAGIDVPHGMTGENQSPVWYGEKDTVRDHVIVENHHDPLTLHVKTYVEDRYKLTVYYGQDYGELFDLQEDPGEVNNLWNDAGSQNLKMELTRKLLHAEMYKESLPMPRVWGA
ncbi:MAG: sulfatase/phosphatase domain-containing protein, partial [Candidatus Latescibacterota bacterium]